MSLGQNIHRLRVRQNMSQGDLADALGVSRQSISKWETDGAVPELEKLIRLSAIFGVTLDELVHGEQAAPQPGPEPTPPPPPSPPEAPVSSAPYRRAGFVLLALAALVMLGCTLLGGAVLGIIFAIPFVIVGLLCMVIKSHPFLWVFWTLLFLADIFLRYSTGLSWGTIRLTPYWSYEMNWFRLFIAWVQFGCTLLMTLSTAFALRKKPLELTGASRSRYICGWLGLVVIALLMRLVAYTVSFNVPLWRLLSYILDWCRIGLFTVMLSATVRWRRTRKRNM